MRVMLLKGQSVYDALRVFIDTLADAFAAQGHDVAVVDILEGPGSVGRIADASRQTPVDLLFSFNIGGEFRDAQGRSLAQIVGAPHVIQLVDYPLAHGKNLEASTPDTALLVIDRSHVDAIRSVYGQARFKHVSFSPHAAIGAAPQVDATAAVFAERRHIPILFAGTFCKPGPRPWADLAAHIREIFDSALDIALTAEWMPALDALDQALRARGLDPTEPNLAAFRKLASFVHEYVRISRRFELLDAAARAGLPVHVYGRGYEPFLEDWKSVIFGGEVDLSTLVDRMGSSRIVLNTNANFGAGSHERPFTALRAGAVAASDHSAFYADAFEEDEMVFYRWRSLRADLETIGALAENPERTFQIAQAGQTRVAREHLWADRIPAIVAAAEAVRA